MYKFGENLLRKRTAAYVNQSSLIKDVYTRESTPIWTNAAWHLLSQAMMAEQNYILMPDTVLILRHNIHPHLDEIIEHPRLRSYRKT